MATRAARIDLPHDLAQFVVEATLGLEEGFWNSMDATKRDAGMLLFLHPVPLVVLLVDQGPRSGGSDGGNP